jgi:uncharacterized protein YndB with AHSA1/START domain
MRSPDGHDCRVAGVYRAVVPLQRTVAVESSADGHGNAVGPSHYGMEGDTPLEMTVAGTLEDLPGGTKLTLRAAGLPAMLPEQAVMGWNQAFDKPADLLPAIA